MAIPPFGAAPTPDATTTKKGKVKLPGTAGSLGGTADTPLIVGPFFNDLIDTVGAVVPANKSAYYVHQHEVANGITNEVASGGYEEVG